MQDNWYKKTLDIYKAHGYDELSVRMSKLCDKSLVRLLSYSKTFDIS